MPRVRTIQQRFTNGEIDPKMKGRTDLEQYYGAAETMTNVLTIPQGGFTRRPGLEHVDKNLKQLTKQVASVVESAPNGGTATNANDSDNSTALLTTTNMSTTNPYVVSHYDMTTSLPVGVVRLFNVGTTVSDADDFFIQGSNDDSNWTNIGETFSLSSSAVTYIARRAQTSYRYIRLARVGDDDEGSNRVTLGEMSVMVEGAESEARLVPFAFNVDQTHMLLFTDKNIAVYEDGDFQIDVPADDFTSAKLGEINWTQSADTAILVHPTIAPKTLVRNNATSWDLTDISFDYIPKFDYTPASSNPAADITPDAKEGSITITATAGVFLSSHVDQYIEGNGGRARIVQFVSNTEVKAVTEIPFFDTDAIISSDWTLLTGYEDVWSNSRGWPRSVMFYEGRLWFGGSNSRPHTIWGSRVNLFFNFNPGTVLADDGVEATLDTDQLNKIVNIYPGRSFQIFTVGGEFAVVQSLGDPITPTNINIKRQTSIGSQIGLRPVEIEGGVLYIQREGKSIQEFVYSEAQQAFVNNYISLLSGHLLVTPVDFSARKSTSTDEGNYLLVVNSNGELSMVSILRSQNITAFTRQTTDGLFKNCGVDEEDMYFVVERTIDGSTDRYLERFNFDHFMDASVRFTTGLPTDTFSGLDHLEGETCKVKADGAVLSDETVSSGSVTIDRDAETDCEVGLDFTPTVKDLPVEALQNVLGTSVGLKKNISEVILRLYETQDITVNGKLLSFKQFGPSALSPLDVSPAEYTGIKRVKAFRGWDDAAQVTISQTSPSKMTVLAMSKRVNISG